MKTKVLLLGAVVTAFALSSFAADSLLSPRAKDNQIKVVSSSAQTPAVTVAYVDTTSAVLSPRAQGNQIKVVKGVFTDRNPAAECRRDMAGTSASCSRMQFAHHHARLRKDCGGEINKHIINRVVPALKEC